MLVVGRETPAFDDGAQVVNLVIGLGQVGKPIMRVLSSRWQTFGRDVDETRDMPAIDVLHICFPWDSQFIDNVCEYVRQYNPHATVIHSTVVPGTTDAIVQRTQGSVVYSPVRGRHGEMDIDLKHYAKFVAGDEPAVRVALGLFESVGMTVRQFPTARALELAKLLETTYSGLLIAWAQEMDRYAKDTASEYLDLIPFFAEIDHLPRVAYQPGHISGHCIMENLDLLERQRPSAFLDAIRASNECMKERGTKRLYPIPMDKFR